MDIPLGFKDAKKKNQVCRLKKSLYGLKQSPMVWFERFNSIVKKVGYNQEQSDQMMFFKHSSDRKIVILVIYVDNIILTTNDEAKMINLNNALSREFEIKNLGALRYFLSIEVARISSEISVSQWKYVFDLLEEIGMVECRPVDTPMEHNGKLNDEEENPLVAKGQYQRLVGKLIYLSHTKLDIAFPISVISRFMQTPIEEHLSTIHRILRYLKLTPGKGLFFGKSTRKGIEVYSNAN